MSRRHCHRTEDVAAFLLHALEPDDDRAFREHLTGCEACQSAVDELHLAADVLPMAAPQMAPPPELKDRIMRVVEAEAELLRAAGPEADRVPARARRGGLLGRLAGVLGPHPRAVLGAACAVLLALVVGTAVLGGGDDGPDGRTVAASTAPPGARVEIETDGERGSLVLRDMPPPPGDRVYQVWVMHDDGTPRPTHTLFTVPADGRTRVAVDAPMRGVRQVLVSAEPQGGSRAPTSEPVVAVRMPSPA
ncbi:anti-sigma factor domain-containing protein [Conexibacter sp. SYSU D00693]|uniref:anti-sigma factor n=1 Tax=Conexibacter sp. SYSU D00693 TaxID=2812560 RepID=UPI00196B9A4E|nr:anti-sigma factor [Conexibacter sp. SYSU D00693]